MGRAHPGGKMLARVFVTLKPGVLDPAGKAVEKGLHSLGYGEVRQVRLGKYLEVSVEETDPAKAKARVEEMCKKLLANMVVENFRVEIG
jgi:phosphoribosylformylglycinamidine synthase subunit PurS